MSTLLAGKLDPKTPNIDFFKLQRIESNSRCASDISLHCAFTSPKS